MKINLNSSFNEIRRAGELLPSDGQKCASNATPIFYRVVNKTGTFESLAVARWSELTWVQKIKFFFGWGEFSLKLVERLVQKTLQSYSLRKRVSHCKDKVTRALSFLREKIVSHNTPHFRLFGWFKDCKRIDIEPLEIAMKKLRITPLPSKSKPEISDETIPSTGRGISNPGCLCYCNSIVQLLHSSPKLRSSIWHDEHNETEALLHSIEVLRKELRKKKPDLKKPSLAEHVARVSGANTIFHNKLEQEDVKGLRKEISKFINTLKNEQKVRVSLLAVLSELDKNSTEESLSHDAEPMKSFIEGMENLFPQLKNKGDQQDGSEFLTPLLTAILPPNKQVLCKDFTIHRIRTGENQTECLRKGLLDGTVEPTVENILAASTIRSAEDGHNDDYSYLILRPRENDEDEVRKISDVFSDVEDSEIYVDNLKSKDSESGEELNSWLTKRFMDILRDAAEVDPEKDADEVTDADRKLPPIKFSQNLEINGTPPTFLPINIARFKADEAGGYTKNKHPVKPLFHLDAPVHGKQASASYTLKGITVHHGTTLDGGHYLTYIPDPSSPEIDGFPSTWVELSDSSVSTVSWESIEHKVEKNATFYMYDLE